MTGPEHTTSRGPSDRHTDVEQTLAQLADEEARQLARTWALAGLAEKGSPDERRRRAAAARFRSAIHEERAPSTETEHLVNGPAGSMNGVESTFRGAAHSSNGHPVNSTAYSIETSGSSKRRADDRAPDIRRGRRKNAVRLVTAAVAIGVAAALVVFVGPQSVTFAVPAGEMGEKVLPDGSHVVVGPSSTLSYSTGPFADDRRVRLDGEAYFSVTEDERTFRIETFNATVTALGTSFNVRAFERSRDPSTQVAMTSGVVKVTGATKRTDARKSVWLQAGEFSEVALDGEPSEPRKRPAETIGVWRSGGFAMMDEPLYSVMEEIERRFGLSIEMSNDFGSDTLSLHLSGAASAEAVLADICGALNCRYVETPRGFKIQPPR